MVNIPHHHEASKVFNDIRKLVEVEFAILGNTYNMGALKFRRERNFSLLSDFLETVRILQKLSNLPELAMT